MSVDAAAYAALHAHGGFADLSERAKFRLSGGDRVRYLNGQVTANVVRIDSSAALPACITSAKGKLNGVVFISAVPDALLIDGEAELRDSLGARLEQYIIADDALLEDVTEDLALFHLLPGAGATLESLQTALSSYPSRTAKRFGPTGLDFFIPSAESDALRSHLQTICPTLDPGLLEVLRIEHGLPRWGAELTETTLPPEAGLDRTHIDYQKGCYIGQEIISRLKSVGRVNRELHGFVSLSGQPLEPGMQLFAPLAAMDSEPARESIESDALPTEAPESLAPVGAACGTITSAAYSFALAKPAALGYLRRGSPQNGLVARASSSGDPVSPADIPVAIQPIPFLP